MSIDEKKIIEEIEKINAESRTLFIDKKDTILISYSRLLKKLGIIESLSENLLNFIEEKINK